jgi:hypothetical protein
MARLACALFAALVVVAASAKVPFWGAPESMPADTPPESLRHGEFIWMGDALQTGPLLVVVSLTEQRAYVYRNGVLLGVTTVSTGRPGHETPTGVFTILQKDRDHRSNIYNSAPMPYMQRLTWGGVALHAGGLPGYPESHGCVHLPTEFARQLYEVSATGMTVLIASAAESPTHTVHPTFLAPANAEGAVTEPRPLEQTETMRWEPQLAPEGIVSMVLSRGSERIVVYRDGVEIGRARVQFAGDGPVGTHVLTLAEGPATATARFVPDPSRLRWLRLAVPGRAEEAGTEPEPLQASRIKLPPEFVPSLLSVLTVGATVLVTDAPLTASDGGGGPSREIIDSNPPGSAVPGRRGGS